MSFEFRDAVRRDVTLLILIAGGTASGKTESAMRVATGLSGGKKFGVIDTEAGRALHKADDYKFGHTELDEPFTPERYIEAIDDAEKQFGVIVIDSGSHVYEGMGGLLDQQEEEWQRLMRGDENRREATRMGSWIKPKMRHKKLVQRMNRSRSHIIVCLRAEDKIEIVKQGGKTVVRPKESLIGAQGWIPICEKRFPFEATISLLVTADAPGVPKPIKLERRHTALIPLDRQLDESVGVSLAGWAAGGLTEPDVPRAESRDAELREDQSREGEAETSDQVAPDRVTESSRSSGSVSPWQQLTQLAKDAGVDEDAFVAAKKAMFPDRRSDSLTSDECADLWAAVEAGVPA